MRPLRGVLALTCWLTLADSSRAVELHYPPAAQHVHMSFCPAGDGLNVLVPDPVQNANETFLLLSPSAAMQAELAGGDTAYPGWTHDYSGGTLSGDFHVDEYESRFLGEHWSGSEISIRYLKGPGDPDDLRWLQMVSTNVPIDPNDGDPPGPPVSPYIDPYPDDDPDGPFYYTEAERPDHINEAKDHGFGKAYDVHFYDFPKRDHPPTSFVKWKGELWLTSVNAAAKSTVFHDGIQYGFEAACIHWWWPFNLIFGNPDQLVVSFDEARQRLDLSAAGVTTLNRGGQFAGVDPQYSNDPMLGATMTFQGFDRLPNNGFPHGLELFRGGAIEVRSASGELLLQAKIPIVVGGDRIHPNYNLTGVFDEFIINPQSSPFLQQYLQFMQQGLAGSGHDKSYRDGSPDAVRGRDPLGQPGHSPQFFLRTQLPLAQLLQGGSSPAGVWNSFGLRDPQFQGALLRLSGDTVSWGTLGPLVTWDLVRGDLSLLLSSSGNFTLATSLCSASDSTSNSVIDPAVPGTNAAFWYLLRPRAGGQPGSYDSFQPSQVGARDAEIAAAAGSCP